MNFFGVTVNTNSLSLFIFAIFNSQYQLFVIGTNKWSEVMELSFLELENLEPSRVCAPDLHIVGFSWVLDVPRLIVISGSNGQGLLVEVPFLGASSIW